MDSTDVSVDAGEERVFAHPKIFYRGIGYCSLSEAVFGVMLEYYIPGFDIVPGRTFQIPLGKGRSCDFLINGILVEYHEVRLKPSRGRYGDFSDESDLREYQNRARRLKYKHKKRRALDRITRQRLTLRYIERRLRHISECRHHSDRELIVATSREDFYDQVLTRFAIVEVPPLDVYLKQFWHLVRVIAAKNERRALSA